MSAQSDFHGCLDRAAGLTVDAACACRAARVLRLPDHHRTLLNSTIDELEAAQADLFAARNDPWPELEPPRPSARHRQLVLR